MIFMWFHFNLCAGILDKCLIGLHNLLGQLSDRNYLTFLRTISISYWKLCPTICVFACDFIWCSSWHNWALYFKNLCIKYTIFSDTCTWINIKLNICQKLILPVIHLFVIDLYDYTAVHFSGTFNLCFLSLYSLNRNYVAAQQSPTCPYMRCETQPHCLVMPPDYNTKRPILRMPNYSSNILQGSDVACIYWTKFHNQVLCTDALKQFRMQQQLKTEGTKLIVFQFTKAHTFHRWVRQQYTIWNVSWHVLMPEMLLLQSSPPAASTTTIMTTIINCLMV